MLRRQLQVTNDEIGKVINAVPPIAPYAVLARDPHPERLLAIQGTRTGVGGVIALASDQQGPRATRFAPDGQGDDGRKRLLLEKGNHSVVVETPVQVQAFEAQTEPLTKLNKQPPEHVQHFVRAPHQRHRQCVALVVLDGVQGGKAMKVCGPALGSPTAHAFVVVLMPSVVGDR